MRPRKFVVTKVKTGEIIIVDGGAEAGKLLGCSREVVDRVCRNKSSEVINGFTVEFDPLEKQLKPKVFSSPSERYGERRGSAYTRWKAQQRRCNQKNCSHFNHYGARGIKVEYSAKEFMDWFEKNTKNIPIKDLNKYDVGRIDHDKNYRLDNIIIQPRSENVKERNDRIGNPKPSIRVRVFNKTLNEERIFDSILAAAKFYKMTDASVAYRCNNKKFRLKKHKDLEFSYVDG